jgi:hypothetical protein
MMFALAFSAWMGARAERSTKLYEWGTDYLPETLSKTERQIAFIRMDVGAMTAMFPIIAALLAGILVTLLSNA